MPIARYDRFVVVSDEKYVIVYDVVKMEMMWKTPLLNVDLSKDIKMRFAVNEKYVVLIKEDYDRKAIYCYNLSTGDILWNTAKRILAANRCAPESRNQCRGYQETSRGRNLHSRGITNDVQERCFE